MRAITYVRPGGPEVLALTDVADPTPGPDEVLVHVHATAVNRADLIQREGNYPPPPGASEILGLECAGVVIAVGADVHDGPTIGDPVMCLLSGGGYAELVTVPAAQAMPIPPGMSFAQAAAIPEVFLTAWLSIVTLGRARAGETVLVHAIASGVGTAAAQICRELGLRCIGTARTPERAAVGREWGAHAVAAPSGAFAAEVRAMTANAGADVIVDLVGARYLAENVASLARFGRLVLTGLVGGRRAELDLGALLPLQATIVASTLRGRTADEKAVIVRQFAEWALPLFADGRLAPVVHTVLPLADAADAHRLLAANEAVGKVVLIASGGSGPAPAAPGSDAVS